MKQQKQQTFHKIFFFWKKIKSIINMKNITFMFIRYPRSQSDNETIDSHTHKKTKEKTLNHILYPKPPG